VQQKCNFVWPSNSEVCGGEVVSCFTFSREPIGLLGWHALYGAKMYEKALQNQDKAICLRCGELALFQEELPFEEAAAISV